MTQDQLTAICAALNRLFWKCPLPRHISFRKNPDTEWAEFWLAELRDGPDGERIEGIEWNAEESEFYVAKK